ncbi:MAG: hypothetical protein WKF37_05220 [Bryobacteraceae bacterium]
MPSSPGMAFPAALVRLRQSLEIGPPNGARDRVDRVLHSDVLYGALTFAMDALGLLEEWLQATVTGVSPQIRLSSCFPYSSFALFATPPRHLWPPEASVKTRWKAARFVPLSVLPMLLRSERLDPERWVADPVSQCLLPQGKHGSGVPPLRINVRTAAPVDRITGISNEATATACIEFAPGAGMWCMFTADDIWTERLQSALRLIGDNGIGGERSAGWGRFQAPQFETVSLPDFFLKDAGPFSDSSYWMLSLFRPAEGEPIDWGRGHYTLLNRSGRTMTGYLKPTSQMIEEGSVLFSAAPPIGASLNVAASGSAHAIYRFAAAFAIPIPLSETPDPYNPDEPESPMPPEPSPEMPPQPEPEPESPGVPPEENP